MFSPAETVSGSSDNSPQTQGLGYSYMHEHLRASQL